METASILLRWLLYSERPLSLEELTEVTMADPQGTSFNAERGAGDRSYVSLTLSSFVSISKDNLVQFAHQTVKDYLLLDATEEGFFTRKADSHAFVARCCLSYMQFCGQSDLKCGSAHSARRRCPKEYTLLEYVFNHWYRHALGAWRDTAKAGMPDEPNRPSSEAATPQEGTTHWSTLPADRFVRIEENSESENVPQSLLEWAASVKLWLNQISRTERVPYRDTLKSLACKGYERSVEFLLATTAPTSCPRVFTAALAGSYKEMIQLILDDAAGGEQSDSPWWPEMWDLTAELLTYKSHEVIVRLLLDHGADVNLVDLNGWTALHTAALQGHETIMKLLLEKGADINVKDCNGRTALHIASSQGHDVVTRWLIEKGADIGARDKVEWTALDLAVRKATMDFQPQDIQVDLGYSGRRMAPRAVQSNHETVARTIRLLSERRPDLEGNCDTETPGLASEMLTGLVRSSGIQNMVIDEGTARVTTSVAEAMTFHGGPSSFIVPFVGQLVLYGGSVKFGMSLIEELLVYGQLTVSARVGLAPILRRQRCSINSATTYLEEATIYRGSAIFSTTARIKSLTVYGGSATFSTTAQIEDLRI
ncbi:hypothetical protein DL764_001848 [Monosporascus ibericus]|uniref:Ankyrin repeat domain-containing protein 54 n=1 Tax=Monosporascus ibericus TaxID=155417 RepID=A0A4Q4TR83_9PEZI|nr:hypothetical protein DL764_001848 [Monosporascus ibericus]